MRDILMERRGIWSPWLWLLKNMDRRDRLRSIIVSAVGCALLIVWMFRFHDGGDRFLAIFPALCVLLMVGGDIIAIVSVLKDQQRRLQAMESKQTPELETP